MRPEKIVSSSGTVAAPFRWADVAAPDRDWLRARTQDVTTYAYRVGCDFARIGLALLEVRKRLKRGLFLLWLSAETPFHRSHAYRLMHVGRAFGGYISQIEKFEPAALYLLARPDVSAQIREYAVEVASDGEPVTRAVALEILAAHRKPVFATGREARDFSTDHAANMRPVRDAEKDSREQSERERRKAGDETADERQTRLAQLGAALEALLANSSLVHVTTITEDEGPPLYSVTVHREDDRPHNAVCLSLLDALEVAGGRERTRRCPACVASAGEKPLSAFGFDVGGPGGRNRYCRACEAPRVKASKLKGKEKRKARAASAATAGVGGHPAA